MKKLLIAYSAVLVMGLVLIMSVSNVTASNIPSGATYDMKIGGTQVFTVQDENGEIGEVTIEEVLGKSRVNNGNYKVTYDHVGSWKAGFYVEISDNKIERVYSPFHSVTVGSISQAVLTKNSTLKATYSFVYKHLILSYSSGVVAKISGTELSVSKK